MAASTLPTNGMIDPTKQAEYPIILGDRLSKKTSRLQSQLVNIQYNYKTKSATAQQRSVITKSPHSRDHFNLTITDKAPNAEQNVLTYSYEGSVDPAQSASDTQEHNLVLVFDPNRKVFVLEPVSTQLNFNLRSAPAKTQKQVIQQYPQLRTLQEDEHTSGDDRGTEQTSGHDDGPADDDNPYDYRHFLPKEKDNVDDDKSASGNATPEPYTGASKANTPLITASKPAPSPRPRPKPQANPLRQKKSTTTTTTTPRQSNTAASAKSKPKSPLRLPEIRADNTKEERKQVQEREDEIVGESSKSSPSETGTGAVSSQKTVPSPGSNIIIDGDLIIDMGSPPPARPFKVNPAHFSSNNTPADNDEKDEDEDIEDLRLPSPLPTTQTPGPAPSTRVEGDTERDEEEDEEDLLAAEMEAAFEEEARIQQSQPQVPSHQYVASEDESEISEEE
ncbi:RNA polymerase II transcription elongation factor-domain-containing protein [Aspergillus egyptiacus]|nr:RNA polymerase II transcription elongation factor-domain-containing protein [Aspergillus egyptiacus]